MRGGAAVILVLMVTSVLVAGEPTGSALDFSLASHYGAIIFGAGFPVGTGFSLVQPAKKTYASPAQEDGTPVGSRLQLESGSLPAPGEYHSQVMQKTMVSKASGSTLLIIGVVLVAGGGILYAETDKFWTKVLGACLVGLGGIAIVKGIEVLIFSGRGGLQTAIRVSF